MASIQFIRERVSNSFSVFLSFSTKQNQLLESLKNGALFLKRYLQDPTTVGSVLPSSNSLARKITCYISEQSAVKTGCHYLEVGPGTGVFTQEILKKMKAGDTLDVVEIDPAFCQVLSKKFENNPHISIHCTSIADWQPDYEYDAVVSGLPLNSFPPENVKQFIDTFKSLTKKGGTISYFEYEFLPRLKLATLVGEEKMMFRKVLQIKQAFFDSCGIGSETVYRNFPPAKVLHFQPNKTDENAG